ncbi:nucleic acid-binding protein [Holotrichia oblita]|uniref:Nucleic acid-binding protein n=1 Tax=Holotrichia oblita TaxID=644536 RepID=A0ACB9TYC7_HOLOL|nr:nucleic acid-binding protein [Holotrichia oblita]
MFSSEVEKVLGMSAAEVGKAYDEDKSALAEIADKANFKQFVFRCRAKYEVYNDENRLKTVAVRVDPVNHKKVFNGDEACLLLCPKESKVLAPKRARTVYDVDRGTAKSSLTVMFTFSASGTITLPMVVIPYKRLPAVIAKSVPDEWGKNTSDNG